MQYFRYIHFKWGLDRDRTLHMHGVSPSDGGCLLQHQILSYNIGVDKMTESSPKLF